MKRCRTAEHCDPKDSQAQYNVKVVDLVVPLVQQYTAPDDEEIQICTTEMMSPSQICQRHDGTHGSTVQSGRTTLSRVQDASIDL
jgi:hypothetical protein